MDALLPPVVLEIDFVDEPFASYLRASFAMVSSGGGYLYMDMLSVGDYTIQSGDQIRYDVYYEIGGVLKIAFDYTCSDATTLRDSGAVDQAARLANPNTDLQSVANVQWYSRIINIGNTGTGAVNHVGKVIQLFDLACEYDGNVTLPARFRDIRVTDQSGNLRYPIWMQTQAVPTMVAHLTSPPGNSAAFTHEADVNEAAKTWVNLSDRLLEAHWQRGKDSELGQPEAGSMRVVLDNSDRALDPANTASPYYPNVVPRREIRLRVPRYWELIDADPDRVGYWRLDEISGTTAFAEAGATNGTESGSPTKAGSLLPGDTGRSLDLDGADDHVDFGDIHDFSGTAPFSVEVWVKPDVTTGTPEILAKREANSTGNGWRLGRAGTSVVFERIGGGVADSAVTATGILAVGQLAHLVATYDGTTMRVYVNGVLRASLASSRSIPNHTGTLRLGYSQCTTSTRFDGGVDEPAIYDKPLNPAIIFAHYRRGSDAWYTDCFRGFTRDPQFVAGKRHGEVEIECDDWLGILAGGKVSGYRPLEAGDSRMAWVLAQNVIPTDRYDLDPAANVEASWSVTNTLLDNDAALAHLIDCADAEGGFLFVDGTGIILFLSYGWQSLQSSQATFSDSPGAGEHLYIGIDPHYGIDEVYNDVHIKAIAAVTESVASDFASQRRYGILTLPKTVWLTTLTATQTKADRLRDLYKLPKKRIRGLTLDAKRLSLEQLLRRDIGQKITVEQTPQGQGAADIQDVFIEQVAHSLVMREESSWDVNWRLSPA